jgi:hypothetical protein
MIEQVIMIVAALCSGMSFGITADGVIGTLCFWRFLLGLGIGGNYPLRFGLISFCKCYPFSRNLLQTQRHCNERDGDDKNSRNIRCRSLRLSGARMSQIHSHSNKISLDISAMGQGIGYLIAGTVCIIAAKIWEGHESGRDYLWRTTLVSPFHRFRTVRTNT